MQLQDCYNTAGFRELARRRMPGPIFHYIDGAADAFLSSPAKIFVMPCQSFNSVTILSGMLVQEALRRQLVQLPAGVSIAKGINHLLKFKVNALLVTDESQRPTGVVSKTDLIGAFYAGLPIDTPLGDIMTGPPHTCYPDDEVGSALERMRSLRVHRLYVTGPEAAALVGTLSYTDVVGLLYRYGRSCSRSTVRKGAATEPGDGGRLTVKDVMTAAVVSFPRMPVWPRSSKG